MRCLDDSTNSINGHELGQTLGDGEGQGAWHAAVQGVAESDIA